MVGLESGGHEGKSRHLPLRDEPVVFIHNHPSPVMSQTSCFKVRALKRNAFAGFYRIDIEFCENKG